MGIITCPDCESEVSEIAEKCPKCARRISVGVFGRANIDIYKLYREKIVHEDTLINFRTSWFVTLQAFLFTSLSLASRILDKSFGFPYVLVLAAVGITVCLTTGLSVFAAHRAINKTTIKWIEIKEDADPDSKLPSIKGAGSSGEISLLGGLSSTLLPFLLLFAWVAIILITLQNHTGDDQVSRIEITPETHRKMSL